MALAHPEYLIDTEDRPESADGDRLTPQCPNGQ